MSATEYQRFINQARCGGLVPEENAVFSARRGAVEYEPFKIVSINQCKGDRKTSVVDNELHRLNSPHRVSSGMKMEKENAMGTRRRILVVDDEPGFRDMLMWQLRESDSR